MRFIFHVATCLILSLLITNTMSVILAIPILKLKALGTIFRAAVGAVIGKRSVSDQRLDDILETDDGDCTKLLVCELAGEKNLSVAEREIVSIFTSGSVTLDPSVARYSCFTQRSNKTLCSSEPDMLWPPTSEASTPGPVRGCTRSVTSRLEN